MHSWWKMYFESIKELVLSNKEIINEFMHDINNHLIQVKYGTIHQYKHAREDEIHLFVCRICERIRLNNEILEDTRTYKYFANIHTHELINKETFEGLQSW